VVPNNVQVAAANAPVILRGLVAATATSSEPATTAGGFFAEIYVIVSCRLDSVSRQLHFVLREDVAIPGFNSHGRAATAEHHQ
jgi:hypothetical protein